MQIYQYDRFMGFWMMQHKLLVTHVDCPKLIVVVVMQVGSINMLSLFANEINLSQAHQCL